MRSNKATQLKVKKSFPSKQSIMGLNALLFYISDIRHGVGPLLSIHLRQGLQWDAARIGIALAIVEFSAFLFQIPAGLLADAAKKKRTLLAGACGLIMLGCLIILFSSQAFYILFAQFLMGISIALILPTLTSITLGLFGRSLFPYRVALNEVWNHLGNVFSALSAGLAGYLFGSVWIFYVLIGFSIGSLLSLLFINPKEINYAIARELPQEDKNISPLPLFNLFKRKEVILFNLSMILYYMANGAQLSLVGQVLANQIPSLSAPLIAACMIIAEVTMILVAYMMSHLVNHFNRKTFFLTAFLILPVRAISYTLVESPYFLLLIQILDGAAAGILGVIGAVIISDLAVNTGRFNFLMGLAAMFSGLGEALSQLFAGFIAQSFGFNTSFFSLAFIAVLGILFFAFLMPETKKPT